MNTISYSWVCQLKGEKWTSIRVSTSFKELLETLFFQTFFLMVFSWFQVKNPLRTFEMSKKDWKQPKTYLDQLLSVRSTRKLVEIHNTQEINEKDICTKKLESKKMQILTMTN